ncbi:DUF4998 domain-containing protein [Anseongella ginsenosidimutans]|nr:DUF4998 domain-containing protein [Anseongella ginsenosidimutans]
MKFHPYKTAFRCLGLALAAWGLTACSEMDDTYDDFLEGGEIIYVQGADSLRIHPGYNRIQLSWLALSDPTVTKAKIYWNNRRDSLEIPVQKTAGVDTMNVMIENLEERIYSFEIYTYDNEGHSSVPTVGTGESFGDKYKNSLLPRLTMSALYAEETDTLEIIWGPVDPTAIAAELAYTDTLGNPRILVLPTEQTGDDTTWITDYDHSAEGRFRLRSVYLPHPMSIDTFYTEAKDIKVYGPPTPFDRTGWVATASSYDGRNGRTDRLPGATLDGVNTTGSIWVNQISPQTEYPHWIAVDMGEVKTETAGVWLGIPAARSDIPSLVDISISDDGENWTIMGRYTVINQAGVQYFDFPALQDTRYFRVDCLESAGGNVNVVLGEIGAFSR